MIRATVQYALRGNVHDQEGGVPTISLIGGMAVPKKVTCKTLPYSEVSQQLRWHVTYTVVHCSESLPTTKKAAHKIVLCLKAALFAEKKARKTVYCLEIVSVVEKTPHQTIVCAVRGNADSHEEGTLQVAAWLIWIWIHALFRSLLARDYCSAWAQRQVRSNSIKK